MASAAASSDYTVGSKVKVTYRGQQTVGEVSSYNGTGRDHWMIVRSPDDSNPNQSLLTTYNVSKVEVEVLERSARSAAPAVSSLPRVNMAKLNTRAHQAVQQKLAAARRVSGGHPQFGQMVCDRLNESGFNCTWHKADIVVLDSVRIKIPYKAENANAEPNARTDEEFVRRIRKIVADVVSPSADVASPAADVASPAADVASPAADGSDAS